MFASAAFAGGGCRHGGCRSAADTVPIRREISDGKDFDGARLRV
jgi:hypothetical protein